MNKVSELHIRAMELAARAELARRTGEVATAHKLFEEAFENESEAASLVNFETEPTRSILHRSAASLAIDCKRFLDAEKHIGLGLSGNAPEEIREELRDIYETITFHRHLELRGTKLGENKIQFSLAGSAVGFGMVSAGEYFPRVQTLDSLLIRTAERKRNVPFREKGRPAKSIIEDLSPYISVGQAASFSVTIRLGGPAIQKQLFSTADDIVTDFIECIRIFSTNNRDELARRITDPAYFRNFVHQAKKLAPDGVRIKTVGFVTEKDGEQVKVALRGAPRQDWETRKKSQNSKRIELQGTLTKAETQSRKDRNIIGVEDASGKVHTVHVPKGLMSDIVRPNWEKQVKIVGQFRFGVISLSHIEPLDSLDSDEI